MVSGLYAQDKADFYKNEIRTAYGGTALASELIGLEKGVSFTNLSLSYFYRPTKFFWVGANLMNYFGEKTYYNWREYYADGSFKDFSKSKSKNATIIAPEIRLSCVNIQDFTIYGGFSIGIGIENGYNTTKWIEYPNVFPCFHLTLFGLSCNFLGKNNNIFFGGEFGVGFKGVGSFHAGYRF